MMNDEILTSDYFDGILRRMRKVYDALTDRAKDIKPMLGGTRLLTDPEACAILKVGKRTMQELSHQRHRAVLPHSREGALSGAGLGGTAAEALQEAVDNGLTAADVEEFHAMVGTPVDIEL